MNMLFTAQVISLKTFVYRTVNTNQKFPPGVIVLLILNQAKGLMFADKFVFLQLDRA